MQGHISTQLLFTGNSLACEVISRLSADYLKFLQLSAACLGPVAGGGGA